ncbi:MAG: hypothetical protein JST00_41020 [Deltaproteobacteria bacterium]|nr:hypothetical protein [Deltaproteobacteria bacterium]
MHRPVLVLTVVALTPACAPRGPTDSSDAPEVGVTAAPLVAPAPNAPAVHVASALVARVRATFPRAADPRTVVRPTADGFALVTPAPRTFTRPGAAPLSLALPARADGVVTLTTGQLAVRVRALGVPSRPGAISDGGVFYAGVGDEDDLLLAPGPDDLEELRIVHATGGRRRFSWRVEGVARVVSGGDGFHLSDDAGVERLSVVPPYAVDARGVRRWLATKAVAENDGWTLSAELDTAGLVAPVVVDPVWASAGNTMSVPRRSPTVVRLASGGAIVVGGAASTADLFDPATAKFTASGPLVNGYRYDTGAVRLASGAVLLVDGYVDSGQTSTAELFDPTTKTFAATGTGLRYRTRPGVFAVPSGAIVVGDGSGAEIRSAERYVASSKTWSLLPQPEPTYGVALSGQTSDGKVIALGLVGGSTFDDATSTWKLGATKPSECTLHQATVAPLGTSALFVVGGYDGSMMLMAGACSYTPGSDTWKVLAKGPVPRANAVAATLADGRIVVIGGHDLGTDAYTRADVYDPATDRWSTAGTMAEPRSGAGLAPVGASSLLVVGGVPTSASPASSTAEIWTPLAVGVACLSPGECASGLCVDGVCCSSTCTGACQACNVAGKLGTCSPLDGAPHAGRSCGDYGKCSAGACATTCGADGDCVATAYCVGTACVPKKDLGAACAATRDCLSGLCVDGRCCNAACGGQCEACDVPGKEGVCWPASGKPRGGRTACGGPSDPTCGARCDGADRTKCNVAPNTTPCGDDACKTTGGAGTETHKSLCTGAGACGDVAKSCGAYSCGATTCHATCTGKSDCAAGFGCKGGACAALDGLGKACTDGGTCGEGLFCTDGVCCGVASCPADAKCVATTGGAACKRVDGAACELDDACVSGHCVDGVCCNETCAGQCQACDAKGSVGKCIAVVGPPHGKRAACDAGTEACLARRCDGVDPSACAGLPGTDTECGAASCKDGLATAAAKCNGKGVCGSPTVTPCGAYACDTTAATCRKSCAANVDCSAGHVCAKGACVPRTSTCSSDGASVVDGRGVATTCAPYVCRDDLCLTTCASTTDCAGGQVCDKARGLCEPVPDAAGADEGCSIGTPGGGARSGGGLFAVFLLGAIVARRRLAAWLFAGAAGCSTARVEPPAPTPSAPSGPLGVVATTGFGGRVQRARRTPVASSVRLSDVAGAPVRLENGPRWMTVAAPGLAGVARKEGRTHTFVGALAETDVVHVADDQGFEELRVLSSAGASGTLTYELATSPDLAVRARAGRLEVVDHGGRVHFRTDVAFAEDARHVRRPLSVEVSGTKAVFRLDLSGLSFPVVVDPAWTIVTSSLLEGHEGGQFAKLASGKILAMSGFDGAGGYSSNAELWDPTTRTSTSTTKVLQPRIGGVAATLPSGKVLVAAGDYPSGTRSTTAALYDPSTGTWAATGSLVAPIDNNHHAVLSTGHVLVVYSLAGAPWSDRPQVFDPGTGSWKKTGLNAVSRHNSAVVSLGGGKALVVGDETAVAEVYDVSTNAWSPVASLPAPSTADSGILLADGRAMVVGGNSKTVMIYDPKTNAWSTAAPFDLRRTTPGLAVLPSGAVVAAGGTVGVTYVADVRVYVPARDAWLEAPPLEFRSQALPIFTLSTGEVWATGTSGVPTTDVQLFKPLPAGTACTLAGECASGYCTDGVCCNVAACGAGSACNTAAGGTCHKLNGETCATTAECGSGFCVDGFCCNAACGGQCEACDVLGSRGTCVPVKGGTRGTRPACASDPADPCKGKTCDGVDRTKCNHPPAGAVACGAASCVGGVETHASTCNGAGACSDVAKGCGDYVCGATACKSTCTTKDDCTPGHHCAAGACVPVAGLGASCASADACGVGLHCVEGVCCGSSACDVGSTCAAASKLGTCTKKAGTKCTLDAECGSGHCVDGVCCDTSCDGQCEACNAAGSPGTCVATSGKPRGARPACAVTEGEPCSQRTCDGVERKSCAAFVDASVTCRAATCGVGVVSSASACDGKGSCPAPTTTSCAGFACDASTVACKTTCATNADCRAGYDCVTGACTASTARCSDDHSTVLLPDGSFERCYPGLCRAGKCLDGCTVSQDCDPRFVCSPDTRTCEVRGGGTDEGGCAVTPGAPRSAGLALLCVALGLTRRRRRPA